MNPFKRGDVRPSERADEFRRHMTLTINHRACPADAPCQKVVTVKGNGRTR